MAQCVEFYYTYKKHVKIGRNGTLLYGEAEPAERSGEEEAEHKVGTFCTCSVSFWCLRRTSSSWFCSRRKTAGSGKGQLTGNRKRTPAA